MPNYGDTRYVDAPDRVCPGDEIHVRCVQKQVYERAWYFLWLGGSWFDSGAKECGPCPSGHQPEDKPIVLCCFAGCYAVLPGDITGPGIVGFLEDRLPGPVRDVMSPTPVIWQLTQLIPCFEVTAASLRFLIDNLTEGEARLRAEGRNSEADQNKKGVECLKRHQREFGW